jgi:predicted lysophospholipase L1 biosynthesis ABC-type transport system permease subunit
MNEHGRVDNVDAELTAIAAREWDRPDVVPGYRDIAKGLRAKVTPLTEAITGSSRHLLLLLFAAVALVLVIACTVSQRTREMGIRIALGATTGDIVALVMREALAMAIIGLVLGTLVAWGEGRVISGLLFQTHPMDPWAIGGAAAVLLGIAVIASLGPSCHAAGLDPALTLRRE